MNNGWQKCIYENCPVGFSVPSSFPLQPSVVVSMHTVRFCSFAFLPRFFLFSIFSCSKAKWWKIRNRNCLVNRVHILVCILSLTFPTVRSPPMSLDHRQWLFHPHIVFPAFIISELFHRARPVQSCPRKLHPNTMTCFQPHSPGSRTARRVWFPFLSLSCIVHPAQCYTEYWLTLRFPPTVIFM